MPALCAGGHFLSSTYEFLLCTWPLSSTSSTSSSIADHFIIILTGSNFLHGIKFPLNPIFFPSFCPISLLLLSVNHLKRVNYICCLKFIICHSLLNRFRSRLWSDHFRETAPVKLTMICTLLNPILGCIPSLSSIYTTQILFSLGSCDTRSP